jgi:hypothetical protein
MGSCEHDDEPSGTGAMYLVKIYVFLRNLPATVPKPPVMMACISDFVRSLRYG